MYTTTCVVSYYISLGNVYKKPFGFPRTRFFTQQRHFFCLVPCDIVIFLFYNVQYGSENRWWKRHAFILFLCHEKRAFSFPHRGGILRPNELFNMQKVLHLKQTLSAETMCYVNSLQGLHINSAARLHYLNAIPIYINGASCFIMQERRLALNATLKVLK